MQEGENVKGTQREGGQKKERWREKIPLEPINVIAKSNAMDQIKDLS